MPIDVTMPDGTVIQGVPDNITQGELSARYAKSQTPTKAPAQPSFMDYVRTNPVIGAPLQTLYRGGQGVEQLLAHGAASVADLGGNYPNKIADALRGFSDKVDTSIRDQNQGYEDAAQRVTAASEYPRFTDAARKTGETMGNMLNPVGMAGSLVKAGSGLMGALASGAVSGGALGAAQPITDPNADYWKTKGKDVAVGAGVGAASNVALAAAMRQSQPEPPSTKDIKKQAQASYKEAEAQGAVIDQNSFKGAVSDMQAAAEKAGMDEGTTPKTIAVLNRFAKEADKGPLTLEKADTLRKVALGALDPNNPSDKRITHIIIDKLDDYIDGLGPNDITATGSAPDAISALQDARQLYARSAKSADIDRVVQRAKNAVGANYTAAGMDTALRQKFRAIADNQRAISRYSPDEQQAIQRIIDGDTVQNTLRWVGKLSPTHALALGAELAGSIHDPGLAIPAAIGGYAAQRTSAAMGMSKVNDLSQMVRRGGSAPLPGPAPNGLVGNNPATALLVQALLKHGAN